MSVKQIITQEGNSIRVSYANGTTSLEITGPFDKKTVNDKGVFSIRVTNANGNSILISTENTESIGGDPVEDSTFDNFFNQVSSFFPDAEPLSEEQVSAINDLIASQIEGLVGVEIDDTSISTEKTYSSSKINSEIEAEALSRDNADQDLQDQISDKKDKVTPITPITKGSASKAVTVQVNAQGDTIALTDQDIAILANQVTDFNTAAQNAVGVILADTSTIDFTYSDATPSITADVKDGSITNAKVASGIDATKIADGSVSNTEFQYIDSLTSNAQDQIDSKANDSAVVKLTGDQTVNGVKTFGSFPITPSAPPITQYQVANKQYVDQAVLNNLKYQGTWNALTNTPTLSDGTSTSGYFYRANVAGSQNLGSGNISFDIGDEVVYNPSGVWEKWDMTDVVNSVFGRTGAIIAQSGDYDASQIANFSEAAQDAIGSILTDTATIDITYNDAGNAISADIKDNSVTNTKISDTYNASSRNLWVDRFEGSSANSGLLSYKPKQFIQQAIDAATFGAVININPYQYNENLTITAASASQKDNLLINSIGSTGSFPTVIDGDLTISGVLTRARFRNIQIGSTAGKGLITFDGDEGRHYFDNIYFNNGITAKNGFKRWHDFHDCSGKGIISLGETGTPAAGCNFYFKDCDFTDVTDCRIGHANITVIFHNCRRLPQKITHIAGNLIIIPPATFESSASTFLESTCNTGSGKVVLWSGYNFMKSDNTNFGRINKTGTCTIYIGIGIRDYANDVLSGAVVYLQKTNDLDTTITPINYTASNTLLNSHLTAIDTKLGTVDASLAGKVTANSAITGAAKTKITYDSRGLVTGGADATTADIADSADKRYVTDAQKTVIGNTSNTNTGDETQATIKSKLSYASTSQDGYVTSIDFNTFNNKESAITNLPVSKGGTGVNDISAQGGKYVRVKSDESGYEFVSGGGSGATAFAELSDVPSSYSGQGGKVVSVKSDASGLEFVSNSGGASALTGLSDTNIVTPSANNTLIYDSATSKWLNRSISFLKSALGLSASDVGLGSVTNDTQLKRSANDFSGFTQKANPGASDISLIEDASASGSKKYSTLASYPISTAAQAALDVKAALVATPTNNNILLTNGLGQPIDGGKQFSTDPTLGGGSPSDSLIATQAAVASGIALAQLNNPLNYAHVLSITNFVAVYNNGSSGVGATLTAVSTGVFTADGYAPALGESVWFNGQASNFQNGMYIVTTLGAIGVAAVFARRSDFDQSAEMKGSRLFPVLNGASNKGMWVTAISVTTVGADPVLAASLGISVANFLLISNALSELTSVASTVRSNIGAAESGVNTDINSVILDQTGLKIKGGSANSLAIKPNEVLSADRILNIITGDADRTINLSNINANSGLVQLNSSGNFTQTADNLPEGSINKWWTNALTIGSALTSFASSAYSAITSSDTVLSALQKIQGFIINLSFTNISGNITSAQLPTNRIYVSAYNTSAQTIPDSTTTAIVNWTKEVDTQNILYASDGVAVAPRALNCIVSGIIRYATKTIPSGTRIQLFISRSPSFTITLSRTSNTVTVTTPTAHGYITGDIAKIFNASNAAFNNQFTITSVPTTTTFRFTLSGVNIAGVTGLVAKLALTEVLCNVVNGSYSGNPSVVLPAKYFSLNTGDAIFLCGFHDIGTTWDISNPASKSTSFDIIELL